MMAFVSIKKRQEEAHNYLRNKRKPKKKKPYHIIRLNKHLFDVLKCPNENSNHWFNGDK